MAESALTVELSADIKNFTAAMQSATAQLSRVAQASRTTNTAVNSMANSMKLAAAGLAAFAGGQIASALNALKANFIELSEAPTRFKASLEALGQSSEQAAAQLDKVYEIAKKTGTGFDDVGTIVRRYTIAMKDLGASNDQINRVVETLLKIGTLGGASVAEMSSTVLQLGQALGSGVLRGEELNAIMESMPLLAQRLAQELGTTTGKLREMGKDGKLASDAVAKALINMSKDVDQSFAKIPLTVDRAMNNVKTAIAQAFNNPAVAQGIQALANGINQFASFIGRALVNIKAFANDMVVLAQTNQTAQAAMLTLVAVISTKLIPAIAALGVALARLAYSNPFTALAAAAAAVATAIITNWDQVKLWLTTALPAAVEGAKASFLSFGADVSESISKFLNWLKDSFRSVIQGIADDWQKLKQVFGYFDAAPKIDFGDTSEKLSSLREGADAARLAQSRLNEEFKKGSDELQRSRAAMDAAAGAADNVSNAFNKIGGAGGKGGGAADSLKKWADNLINTIDPANKLAQEIEKLNSAFAKGYLNAEQYAKGLEQIK